MAIKVVDYTSAIIFQLILCKTADLGLMKKKNEDDMK